MAALRETSVLFAALIGSLTLHEPFGLRRTVAAAAIVDSILDDQGPLRHACDPMGAGLLTGWRQSSDEEAMQGMLNLFAPPSDDA